MDETNNQPELNVEQMNEQNDTTDNMIVEEVANLNQDSEIAASNNDEQTAEEFLEIKYNKEEKKLSKEEAIELAQKGMNYDKLKDELELYKNNKGLTYLQSLAEKNNITEEQLVEYLESQEEENSISNFANKYGIENLNTAKELYEMNTKAYEFEKQQEDIKKAKEVEERQKKEFENLSEYFKNEYGRTIDVEKDISNEVFEIQQKQNVSLEVAFIINERNIFKKGQAVAKQNLENINSTTGSLNENGGGSNDTDYISKETVEKNKNDSRWINRNLSKIEKSMSKW